MNIGESKTELVGLNLDQPIWWVKKHVLLWTAGQIPWCPCGLQGRSVGPPCACVIYVKRRLLLRRLLLLRGCEDGIHVNKDARFALKASRFSARDMCLCGPPAGLRGARVACRVGRLGYHAHVRSTMSSSPSIPSWLGRQQCRRTKMAISF